MLEGVFGRPGKQAGQFEDVQRFDYGRRPRLRARRRDLPVSGNRGGHIASGRIDSRKTIRTTPPRCAPSAILMPISPVRRATLYETVP